MLVVQSPVRVAATTSILLSKLPGMLTYAPSSHLDLRDLNLQNAGMSGQVLDRILNLIGVENSSTKQQVVMHRRLSLSWRKVPDKQHPSEYTNPGRLQHQVKGTCFLKG